MSEPIGQELSIDIKAVPELEGLKAGDTCAIKITGTIMGNHQHEIGKDKAHMYDIKITGLEYEEEKEADNEAQN